MAEQTGGHNHVDPKIEEYSHAYHLRICFRFFQIIHLSLKKRVKEGDNDEEEHYIHNINEREMVM